MDQARPSVVHFISLLAAVDAKQAHDGRLIVMFKCYRFIPSNIFEHVILTLRLVQPDGAPVLIRGSIQDAPEANRSANWHAYRFMPENMDITPLFLWQYPHRSNLDFVVLEYFDTKRQIKNHFFEDPNSLRTTPSS